jgi:methylthioribose-1-phosphate isomerase
LLILDQTLLPHEVREIALATTGEVAEAIRSLRIRGAPAIGIAAAYGLVVAAGAVGRGASPAERLAAVRDAHDLLLATRPTAVNLRHALRRTLAAAAPGPDLAALLLAEARALHEEDRLSCERMAHLALRHVRDGGTYLTHCNAGALATGGIGTALGVFHLAAGRGFRLRVYADETRPLLQGARLTAWELAQSGVAVTLLCDSAAASVLAAGRVEAVFVGADRIAANGDVANKVGTWPLSLAAREAKVPFFVVAPWSTFDLSLPSGRDIPIEERSPGEVLSFAGRRTAAPGADAANPAFDVTPAALVTAIVTERGIIAPVTPATVAALASG